MHFPKRHNTPEHQLAPLDLRHTLQQLPALPHTAHSVHETLIEWWEEVGAESALEFAYC